MGRRMFDRLSKTSSPWVRGLVRHRAWILVGLTLLFVVVVRVRLREMPLERDEGEYAYVGQLILQGTPPYKEAYTMKLPGTYAAYALIMAVLGQSAAGIHLGLAVVNVASIILMFLLGRRLLGEGAGVAAAVAFALMSLSPSVLGLAGHATHFVVLAALGGTWVLTRACEARTGSPSNPASPIHYPLFVSGLLFGLAFLMKQHGLFFGLFGVIYLLRERVGSVLRGPVGRAGLPRVLREVLWFGLGWLLPYGLTCLVLWWAGALRQFVFWTITYASEYASAIPIVQGPDVLRASSRAVVGPNLVFWLLPWVGALVMWWDARLAAGGPKSEVRGPKSVSGNTPRDSRFTFHVSHIACPRFFLMAWLLCSAASLSVGLYFREHYFILVLPVLALLSGVAVSRGLYLLRHDQTIELFLAVPILGAFAVGVGAALIGHGPVWLTLPVGQAMRSVFGSTLFAETARVADYLKTHAPKDARIAVLGSEPQVYFLARRRAATGHLYMYPLMEDHPHALKLQEEMIAEIERARPAWLVYVDDQFSWLIGPQSPPRLLEWWKAYWEKELDVVMTVQVLEGLARGTDMDKPASEAPRVNHILVFKRKQEAK